MLHDIERGDSDGGDGGTDNSGPGSVLMWLPSRQPEFGNAAEKSARPRRALVRSTQIVAQATVSAARKTVDFMRLRGQR